ncbi:hypothetical protein [Treponema brennaborense]|uniref:Lipoprotein n=1 Tax=Treponema brennaborense (strain DSM 12168 / CIP 105900 / DD5/3) TaxID=906968 RepID=F4LN70_TREBD|nr:hypothetical protein [Treponema brennaborense]AEE16835.1 hypothetical protein Trebr_1411 [Treponema brennaborense DSM 12168]
MNKQKYNVYAPIIILLYIAAICFVSGCAEPSPLYGTWADNRGDKITLMADGNFNATITDALGVASRSEGAYTVLLNAISFTTNSGKQIVSEWDIRGNMLYLTWTSEDGDPLSLTLYKTAN